ncbi:hypothetical protein AB6735_24265 [Mucilaginibacter sp. RCC_168]|uniref:hypothetical protein n=1 Tax=Mucilaginibacter sp. RCC_168 TaxID=3239221 RepID=UPI003524AF59
MAGKINRANQLWQNWQDKHRLLEGMFSGGKLSDPHFSRQKYDFLQKGITRISVNPTPDEKIVLGLLKGVTAKLEKELYPNRLVRFAIRLKHRLYDQPRYLRQQAALRAENLELLAVYMDAKGFGSFSGKLENYLDYERDKVNIELSTQLSGSERLDVMLHLEKDGSGRYQLPRFTAGIVDRDAPERKREYTFEDKGVTDIQTAANLLAGRPVFSIRQQQLEQNFDYTWLQLEFNPQENGKGTLQEYRHNYGFDPDTCLKELARATNIPAIADEKVLSHIEKGNVISFKCPTTGEALFLQANPGDKNILIRDTDQKPVTVDTLVQRQQAVKKRDLVNKQKLSRKRVPDKKQEMGISLSIV